MKNAKQFSTALVAIVIAFLSIYAIAPGSFSTTNNTAQAVTVTLQLQSGLQMPVSVGPNSSIPTMLNGDQVMGMTIYGIYAPVGVNIIVPSPVGGSIQLTWQMGGDGTCYGGIFDPYEVS